MAAYYNEIDPYAAQWLRNLIAAGHIAPGDVDERDIWDVRSDEVAGYTQCHFFAGIGIWSAALRDAGWPDDQPVWTGSCPCQPFSAAGKGGWFDDERHAWPALFHLIGECRPAKVFGEQVASQAGLEWYDLVSADLEAAGYAVGAADLCAAGIAVEAGETETGRSTIEWIRGALQSCPDPFLAAELRDFAEWFGREGGIGPAHIRQRLYWMADEGQCGRQQGDGESQSGGIARELGNAESDAERQPRITETSDGRPSATGRSSAGRDGGQRLTRQASMDNFTALDWIICTDGKARPTQPGLFPLAHGTPGRVGRLRAYGNAIVPQVAQEFIKSVMKISITPRDRQSEGK